MSIRWRGALAAAAFACLFAAAAWGADTATQKEVRARRAALVAAINSHKVDAVMAFYDKAYESKSKDGQVRHYDEQKAAIEQAFQAVPDFKATSKIERIEDKDDTAQVTVANTITGTSPQGQKIEQSSRSKETWKKTAGKWLMVRKEDL